MRQYVRKKYRQDLEGLADVDPQALAALFRGEILPGRPYASVKWVILLKPFRPLEVFILFDQDPEFGTDLRIFYARKSLTVPTEDAYVFAWDYVALLARYGRGAYPLTPAAPGDKWLPLADFAPEGTGPMKDASLGAREEALLLLNLDLAEVAVRRLDSGEFSEIDGGWEVAWPVLGDLAFRLSRTPDGIDLAFDDRGARKYPPEFLLSFSWLYINALLREYRQVDPSLPRLSRYF
ncbi:MAG: hypothetical protein FJ134_15640 [Deltaproteobacteria bacterium]|nr:hypothetical protein [Deltaproteobacteria bacterium]